MGDLRERVAKAMCDAVNAEGTWEETGTLHREKVWLTAADAAIAIARADALEEAARVVAAMPRTYDKVREDVDVLGIGKGAWTLTLNNGPKECAAAIRALKEGK